MSNEKSFTPGLTVKHSPNAVTREELYELRNYTEKDKFTVVDSFTAKLADMPTELEKDFQFHGMKQKIGDTMAMTKAESPTPTKKFNRAKEEHTRLMKEKTWKKPGKTTIPKLNQMDTIIKMIEYGVDHKGIANVCGVTIETVELIAKRQRS